MTMSPDHPPPDVRDLRLEVTAYAGANEIQAYFAGQQTPGPWGEVRRVAGDAMPGCVVTLLPYARLFAVSPQLLVACESAAVALVRSGVPGDHPALKVLARAAAVARGEMPSPTKGGVT